MNNPGQPTTFVLTATPAPSYGARPMHVHLLILNFNGRRLLAECLPSVVEAARCSRHRCDVAVIDNASRDDSVAWLGEHYPQVGIIRRPNRGLCSYNNVVPLLPGRVAVLLNNDVKLDPGCVDPLVEPLESPSRFFMTAPLCWGFDGRSYEGLRTAVDWHWGLVRATALFPGHEPGIRRAGPTASAGAVMAVDRQKFAELGGFDPVYLPGRLEDLDLAFRAYLAGYRAWYVPEAVAYHQGMATFGGVYGRAGCDALALRNTLLFQWKNLHDPRHLARQVFGLLVRLAAETVRAPWAPPQRRFALVKGLLAALRRGGKLRAGAFCAPRNSGRERAFFEEFHPRRMRSAVGQASLPAGSSQASLPAKPRQMPGPRGLFAPLAGRNACPT